MKIALLNLPIDNNYGGNLQRYALMKVLQDMGHDVTHIQLRYRARLRWQVMPFVYAKRILIRYLLHKPVEINREGHINRQYKKRLETILPFYEKNIKHTEICYTTSDIRRQAEEGFCVFIVGSDQCWRKDMNNSIGWKTFLLDFLAEKNIRRVAYGASFGMDYGLFEASEAKEFRLLYERFYAVSVREKSGSKILTELGCLNPTPQIVLDPTLLLSQKDYFDLMNNEKLSSPAKGKVFCYMLDKTIQIEKTACEKANELNTDAVFYGIYGNAELSIEMWLKSIYESKYVITDSYHGTIFSIIFNKPFIFCGNERRGNTRIESLFELLNINDSLDYVSINKTIDSLRNESKKFINNALS